MAATTRAPQAKAGPTYWRSLNELAQTPEFEDMLQPEFSALAADVIEPSSRRDFLTTSDVPGEAMKASDGQRAQGAILGKAMTPFDGAHGTVLVLVTLQ